jgi:hypothetical protein
MEMQKIGNKIRHTLATLLLAPLFLAAIFCVLPHYALAADAFSYE